MLSSSSSSSSSSSVLSSSRPLQRRGIQRHASSNGRSQRSQLRASSTSRDVTTIANVSVPMQILKPNGEPKVVYIFNSKTCDGSAELKDILGNKCVLCSFCLLGSVRKVLTYLSSLTNSPVDTFFDVISFKKKNGKQRGQKILLFFLLLLLLHSSDQSNDRSMKTTTAKKKRAKCADQYSPFLSLPLSSNTTEARCSQK